SNVINRNDDFYLASDVYSMTDCGLFTHFDIYIAFGDYAMQLSAYLGESRINRTCRFAQVLASRNSAEHRPVSEDIIQTATPAVSQVLQRVYEIGTSSWSFNGRANAGRKIKEHTILPTR